MSVCLFVCLVAVMFLSFRPYSYDSVAICPGCKIKDGVLLVEHLCLPGVQPLFRLKFKCEEHNSEKRAQVRHNFQKL